MSNEGPFSRESSRDRRNKSICLQVLGYISSLQQSRRSNVCSSNVQVRRGRRPSHILCLEYANESNTNGFCNGLPISPGRTSTKRAKRDGGGVQTTTTTQGWKKG